MTRTLPAALLAALAACGPQKPAPPSSGPVQVLFWHAMGGPVGEVLDELIAEYNRANPSVRIVGQSMGNYGALSQKLLASVIAGSQPDMAQAYENWIAKFVAGGHLAELDTFLPDPAERQALLSDLFPVMVSNNTYDGRLMSLPFNKSTPILYYNREMFREAGLDPDRPPATWDEFAAAAKRLSRGPSAKYPKGVKGFVSGVNVSEFQCFLHQNGGRVSSEQTPDIMEFDSDEAVGAVRFLLDLKHIHKAADFYVGSGFEFQNDFLSRQSAMMITSCVSRTYMADRLTFDWGYAPLPRHKRSGGLIYGTGVVIFKTSPPERQKAAWDFIRWFNSPDIQVRWALRTGYIPVRYSCLQLPPMRQALRDQPTLAAVIRQVEQGFFDPRTRQWFTGRQNLEKALSDIFTSPDIPKAYAAGDLETVNRLIRKELQRGVRQTERWFGRHRR